VVISDAAGAGVGIEGAGTSAGGGLLNPKLALGTGPTSTGAMKRYPRRGNVSMKRGASAESPSASRRRATALFRP